jgi:hypothetical protein
MIADRLHSLNWKTFNSKGFRLSALKTEVTSCPFCYLGVFPEIALLSEHNVCDDRPCGDRCQSARWKNVVANLRRLRFHSHPTQGTKEHLCKS